MHRAYVTVTKTRSTGTIFGMPRSGRPIGGDETKAQLYENIEGLFIREFTNGWAVYNRSGKAQEIELAAGGFRLVERCGESTPAYVGRFGWRNLFEGEIAPPTADVNADGISISWI